MSRWSIPTILALLTVTACLALLGAATVSEAGESQPATADASAPPPGAAVFEMKYRGLDTPDDPLGGRSLYAFSTQPGSEQRDPFVLAVKSQVKDCSPVYNGSLPQKWAVVEFKNNEPATLYFDLNADGKLSDNEKFPLAPKSKLEYPYVFITSDFQIRTREGREMPFRVLLIAIQIGNGKYAYNWSPHCVLEGQATLAGTPMKLVLACRGFDASFASFGQGSFSLIPAEQKIPESLPWSTLSSVINQEGTFYRLRVPDTRAQDSVLRVVLEKDTSPTGRLALHMAGKEETKAQLAGVQVRGAKDATIQIFVGETEPTLPVGPYQITYGDLTYGRQKDDEWQVRFNEGPIFEIKEGQTTRLAFGAPVLSIKAVAENDRYLGDAQERTTYAKGTPIYLSPQIKGKAGEIYRRFGQRDVAGNNVSDVKPHIAILDANEKLIVSADMEYG